MSHSTQQQPVSPPNSTTPLVASYKQEIAQPLTSDLTADGNAEEKDPKTGKRRFFGLGRKKEDKQAHKDMSSTASVPSQQQPAAGATLEPSQGLSGADLKPQQAQPIPISPSRSHYQSTMAASPSRLRSASPRLHSPASSEIFERNVQEPAQIVQLQGELSPAHIPAHVITEDHIPPALEASAQAITSEELGPDEVEIVMSTAHQPAAAGLEGSSSHLDLASMNNNQMPTLQHVSSEDSAQASSMLQPGAEEEGASNYGQIDPNDPRRLSFISFADVIQSEHQAPPSSISEMGTRDNLHMSSVPSINRPERTASPLRQTPLSPTSASGGVTTPPNVSVVSPNLEQSPGRSLGLGSPLSTHSELTIETMRQAVRKTASGDLSGGRSTGMSPVSEEIIPSAPRSRTNS